ncbi:MAG TPA: response regulator transcription factor [Victivallales bacterium]|nr:response regulator transcription factor [Victivallales bacterium]
MNIYKVFIVDDHAIVRSGIINIVDQENNMEVIGSAESFEETIEKLKKMKADIILVDINLKDRSGLDLISELKCRYPDLPALVLSMYDEFYYAPKALSVGAKGYIMKSDNPDKIIDGINKILNGETYFCDSLNDYIGENQEEIVDNVVKLLSVRELEIFRFFGLGYSTKDMAKKLCISTKTVQTYSDRIRTKLGLKSSNDLVRSAVKWLQL